MRMQCEHRGVKFERTPAGAWIFDRLPSRGGHWDRYFTEEEVAVMLDKLQPIAQQFRIMCDAIDREREGFIVYTGDLRDRRYA